MKVKLFFAVLTICIVTGCTKSSKTSDPTEDFGWLKAKKTEMSKNCACIPSIWQSTYEGKTIYETGCVGPNCLCVHLFYDNDGKIVQGSEKANIVEFHAKLTNRKLLWSCQ